MMAERVHPSAGASPDLENQAPAAVPAEKFVHESFPPRMPKSGTYVIQVPKDQIYRLPPPENAHLFQSYSRRTARNRRRSCYRCIAWTFFILLLILLLLGLSAAILYFVYLPKIPSYSLEKLAIKELNVTAGPATIFPEFDVTLRADNGRNKKVGLKYEEGSDIGIYYLGVLWSHGSWPAFYQPSKNVTVIHTVLKGSGIQLSSVSRSALIDQQRKAEVPLEIDVKVEVKVKFGAVSTWKIAVKVNCDVVVDKMTVDLKMVSKDCRTKVHF